MKSTTTVKTQSKEELINKLVNNNLNSAKSSSILCGYCESGVGH